MPRLGGRVASALPASPLHGLPARDERDWRAIDRWADALPEVLSRAPVPA